MYTFCFTNTAEKIFSRLEKKYQSLIRAKLIYLKDPEAFQQNAKTLHDLKPATHRIKVGSYRVLLQCDFFTGEHLVLKIAHRRDVYNS